MELTTSSLKGSCKTALRNTLAIKDNVGEDQITLMQFSLGTTIEFFRCKEMLVLYPGGMLEHGVRKESHAGLPSGMSLYSKRKRKNKGLLIWGIIMISHL
jgi:hypothetical protein